MESIKDKNQSDRIRGLDFCLAKTVGVVFFSGLFLFSAEFAAAEQDSCEQCKFLRCLKSTVERKQNLIKVYQGMQDFWGGRNLGKDGKPVMEIDLAAIPKSERAAAVDSDLSNLSGYGQMEEERTQAVPAAEGCGYPEKVATPSTNTFSCETTGVAEAFEQQPCKELANLIAQHEGVHQQACEKRKSNPKKNTPGRILTPAGKAAEEIAAYQLEIGAINKIIEKLKKKCGKTAFNNITIDCVIKTPQCTVRTGQKLAGHVCGDPTKETWTIEPQYFAEGCGMPAVPAKNNKPFSNDCVAAGSDIEKRRADTYRSFRGRGAGGWMCVYSDAPSPKITIRSFRMSACDGAAEQTITVDAQVSETCDEQSPPAGPPASPRNLPNS